MKNFDDLFREGLADHAEVPPRRVWETLEKRLDAPATGARPGNGWYWYAGVASVALLVGSIALSISGNSEGMAPAAPIAPAVAATTNVAPITPETAVNESVAENGQKKNVISRTRAISGHEAPATDDRSKVAVSPYGNAPAVGTKLHSYDDFDERATASAQKQSSVDEAAAANGYRVNRIRKHRLVAAEMVPVAAPVPPAYAANVEPAKTPAQATARNDQRTAPVQRRPISVVRGTGKPVVLPTPAAQEPQQPVAANEPATDNATKPAQTQPVADAAPVVPTRPATMTATTSSRPAPSGSAVAAVRPKPNYTTGGSEPAARTSDSGNVIPAANAGEATGSSTAKKKGIWNIFSRPKKNNSK